MDLQIHRAEGPTIPKPMPEAWVLEGKTLWAESLRYDWQRAYPQCRSGIRVFIVYTAY